MALSPPRLVTPEVGSGGPSITTASFSPLANEDLIVRCFTRSGTTVDLPEIANDGGLTFALLSTVQHNPVQRQRIWRVNVGASPPASMSITCSAGGSPQAIIVTVLGQSGSSGDYSNIGSATSTVGDVTVALPVAPAADSIVIGFFGQALGSALTAGPAAHTLLSTLSAGTAARTWAGYDPAPASDTAFYDSAATDTRRSVAQLIEVKNVPAGAGAVAESLGLNASFTGQMAAGRAHSVTMGMDMSFTASIAGQGSPENPAGVWRGAVRTWAMPSGVDPIAGDNLTFSSGGVDPPWWALPIRSGRASASGTSIWYDRPPPDDALTAAQRFAAEEADVALIDGIAGSSKGESRAHVATMNLVFGRTSGGADDFTDTQFDWRVSRPFFGLANGLAHLPTGPSFPQGSGWIFWVMQFVPTDRSTEGGNSSIWTEYANETHDDLLVEFGDRFRRKVDATGHPRDRFIIDAHHEMNQSNSYQIFAGTRTLYRNAMARIITKVREGAGYHVRFCHRPAYRPDPGDTKIGPYNSFIPDGIDVLALSVHPAGDCDTSAKIDQLFAGTLNSDYFGTDELIATAGAMNLPIAFPEWSPKFETVGGGACPVANAFYQKFFNNVIVPNRSVLVFDGVWNQNVRDLGAYEGTQPGGSAQWDAGVVTRKTLWSGIKS